MNPKRSLRPPVPSGLSDRERAAFALWDSAREECRLAGYTLLISVRGFKAARFVVVELCRGTNQNARQLRDCATWRVSEGLWLHPGERTVECEAAEAALALIRRTMAAGEISVLHRRKKGRKTAKAVKTCHLSSRPRMYLGRDLCDRDGS